MAKKKFKKEFTKPTKKAYDPNLVKAKKFLGQHFLEDETIDRKRL